MTVFLFVLGVVITGAVITGIWQSVTIGLGDFLAILAVIASLALGISLIALNLPIPP